MTSCDVCGANAVSMALIEGAKMNVCFKCLRFGREIKPTFSNSKINKPVVKMQELELASNYSEILIAAREDLNISREELAKKLAMREQDLKNFENGKVKPTQKEAEKLQFSLGISILKIATQEQTEEKLEKKEASKQKEKYAPTLGELVTIKTKKN